MTYAADRNGFRRTQLGLDVLQALPNAGPKACLSHQVLLSSHDSPKRHRSLSQRTEDSSQQQFVLPVLSPRRGADAKGLAAIIRSARGRREKDLLVRPTPPKEGMVRSLLREKQAPPVPLSRDDGERALQELEAQRGSSLVSRTYTPRGREASTENFSQEQAEARRLRLAECFRIPAEKIKEAFLEAFQWHVLPELTSEDPQLLPKAKALQSLLEDAELPPEIRPSVVTGTDERGSGGGEGEHTAAVAHKAEISAAFSYLNFVRWLCGLQKVSFNASKQSACTVTCEALLPRGSGTVKQQRRRSSVVAAPPVEATPKPKPRAKKLRPGAVPPASPPVQLAQELAEIAKQDAMSVLQGEGSLVSAIEQSLSAFRCANESEVMSSDGPATARRSLPPVMDDAELPSALQQFKVLWQIGASDPGSSVSQRGNTNAQASPTRRSRLRDSRVRGLEAAYGVDTVWGDRRGSLAARRRLLNPALRSFAAARYDDVCVFWTGRVGCVEAFEDAAGHYPASEAAEFDTVSFPPVGLVPVGIVEGESIPWTVMPDATRFQPTSATTAQVWQVHFRREDGVPASAIRRRQVHVSSVVVDCSNHGESFCVIFWPDIDPAPGLQLEVVISGLCGAKEEVTNFYEFISFRRKAADEALAAEATRIRDVFQQADCLWQRQTSQDAQQPAPKAGQHNLVQPLSHLGKEIVTDSNDLVVTVRCTAAVLRPVLSAQRFDGDYVQVARACHVIHLSDEICLVRIKLPLATTSYQLQFSASAREAPRQVQPQPLWYTIRTTGQCTSVVRSIEDRMMNKFGFAKTELETQLSGVTLLAPSPYRVLVGQVYFLVFVDRNVALAAARDALPPVHVPAEELSGPSIFTQRLLPQEPSSPREVRKMHQILQEGLGKHTQVSSGDIHLDLMLHNGQHVHRLRERHDLPGLYESLLTISDLDASTKIQLVLRFPRIHACDFSPRRVAEWLVTRGQDRVKMSDS